MNKAYFMSFVLAAALSAMADEVVPVETYDTLFTGVSGGQLVSNDGGLWTTNGAAIATTNVTAVSFETADSTPIGLNVTAEPADTNTIVKVELQVTLADVGKFADISESAQTAFCVCTNSFNAWNGSRWVALNEVPAGIDESQPTNLTVEISYQDMKAESPARKARFTVGDTILVTRDGSSPWVNLGASAIATNNLAGFAINGEGIIAQADAKVMLGVAEYAGVKYGTISNAVEVAKGAGGTPTVEVLRETDEDVTEYAETVNIAAADDVPVKVNPDGGSVVAKDKEEGGPAVDGANGVYTATLNGSVATHVSAKNLQITLPYPNKEVKPNSVDIEGTKATFEVRTASSVLRDASVDEGKNLTANVERLHEYLAAYAADAYEDKDVTSETISTALATTQTGGTKNGLPLYQSYALGIAPTDSVKPVTVANDTDPDAITLSIPALNSSTPSGDYTTIKYVMTKPNSQTVQFNKGTNIAVPLSTGSYQVKIVME